MDEKMIVSEVHTFFNAEGVTTGRMCVFSDMYREIVENYDDIQPCMLREVEPKGMYPFIDESGMHWQFCREVYKA